MENKENSGSLYYRIVGKTTNTNEGLARLLAAIAGYIVVFGTIFWAMHG